MSLPAPQDRRGLPDHLQFRLEKLILPAGEVRPSPTTKHHICMHVGAPVVTRRSLDGRTQQRVQLIGDFDVIPAGMAGVWRNEGSVELLLIDIDPEFVGSISDDVAPAALLPTLKLRDPHLQHLALALVAEQRGMTKTGRVYVESLMTALLARLISIQDDAEIAQDENGDRLTVLQQQRLVEFIEAHIASDLSLASLAAIAGYGLSRFKTLFKNSFGCTPHSYVVARRLERARTLIETGRLPLSEIALESGFSHQSHMALAFRQAFGVLPGQIRRHQPRR